jgi:hypothetical protein
MPRTKIKVNMENLINYGWARSKLQLTVGAMPICWRRVMENSPEEGL